MRRFLATLIMLIAALCLALPAQAKEYKTITAKNLRAKMEKKEPLLILDLQGRGKYAKHHLPGALSTAANPVKTAEDKAKIDPFLKELSGSKVPIIIVDPRGAGPSQRAYEYLMTKGIAEDRLFILEKGQEGWPFPDMTLGK